MAESDSEKYVRLRRAMTHGDLKEALAGVREALDSIFSVNQRLDLCWTGAERLYNEALLLQKERAALELRLREFIHDA